MYKVADSVYHATILMDADLSGYGAAGFKSKEKQAAAYNKLKENYQEALIKCLNGCAYKVQLDDGTICHAYIKEARTTEHEELIVTFGLVNHQLD